MHFIFNYLNSSRDLDVRPPCPARLEAHTAWRLPGRGRWARSATSGSQEPTWRNAGYQESTWPGISQPRGRSPPAEWEGVRRGHHNRIRSGHPPPCTLRCTCGPESGCVTRALGLLQAACAVVTCSRRGGHGCRVRTPQPEFCSTNKPARLGAVTASAGLPSPPDTVPPASASSLQRRGHAHGFPPSKPACVYRRAKGPEVGFAQ